MGEFVQDGGRFDDLAMPCLEYSGPRKRGTQMLKLHKTQEGSKLTVGLEGQLDAFTITGFLDVLTIQ